MECIAMEHDCVDYACPGPVPTPSQEIVGWEKEFDRKMSELGQLIMDTTNGNGPDDPEDIAVNWKEGMRRFIRQLLSSHSQALQERHEAGFLKLVNDLREDYKCPDKDCAPCYSRESVLSAVESYATHLNPKS